MTQEKLIAAFNKCGTENNDKHKFEFEFFANTNTLEITSKTIHSWYFKMLNRLRCKTIYVASYKEGYVTLCVLLD